MRGSVLGFDYQLRPLSPVKNMRECITQAQLGKPGAQSPETLNPKPYTLNAPFWGLVTLQGNLEPPKKGKGYQGYQVSVP